MPTSTDEPEARDDASPRPAPCSGGPGDGALWLTDNFPVGAYVFYRDPDSDQPRFGFFSNRLLEMLDINRAELEADPMVAYQAMHPDDIEAFWIQADAAAKAGTAFNIDCRYVIRGEVRWYRLESAPRHLPDRLIVWDGAVIDISERKQLELELRRRASIDALTGLLSREELLLQLGDWLSASRRRRRGEQLALLFLDLNLFKQINDQLGHAAGDTVLRTVATRIRQKLRSDDLAGRMGGDEIIVVLRGIGDASTASSLAETLATTIEQPIHSGDTQISISASIGVTMAQSDDDIDSLIARADLAMYRAKQSGGRCVVLSD